MCMIDEDFFKTLNLLYVENDENVRDEFLPTFEKLFKKVFIAVDGNEALDKFNKTLNSNDAVDIIISEAILSDACGIELLTDIRKINKNIPFVFFTETGDVEVLLKSLRQDVTAFFMKPLALEDVLVKIEEICKVKKRDDEIAEQQDEVEDYLRIINKVALVFIFDIEGNIVYINDFLQELVKCRDEEILGQNYSVIYHHEMPKVVLDEQWKTIKSGEKWNGKMKYLTKQGAIFYTNATIIPVFSKLNNEIRKFISVNFLTTKEENEKREFKKKVLYNLQETKRVFQVAQQKINELNIKLEKYQGYEKVEEYLTNQKKENIEYYAELQNLENRLKASRKRFEQLTFGVNEKINKISIMTADMKNIEEKATKKIDKVAEEIKVRESFIHKIKAEIEEKAAKIRDLEDVVKHRTEQLVEKKG